MKKIMQLVIVVLSIVFLFACQNGQPNIDTDVLTGVVKLPTAMRVDSTDGLVVIPYETEVDNTAIEWSSSNPNIATVNQDGGITVLENGDITISASSGENTTNMRLIATKDYYKDYIKITSKIEYLYIFSNPENFNDPSKKYSLETDIDFNGDHIEPIGGWDVSNEETPVDPSKQFRATLDGRGYALKNFTISNPPTTRVDGAYYGVSLIPFIDDGVVRNLNIIDATFSGTGFTGSVAGKIENGLIENVFIRATITSTSGNAGTPSGGIVGIIGANATVQNVILDVKVTGGHIYSGFNFGTGTNCNAVSETLDDENRRGPMRNTAITTNKGNEEEDAALNDFINSLRIEHVDLASMVNYSLSEYAKTNFWTITDGYMPFIIRADGVTPIWAKLS
jgi:hypothetical protein